MSVDLERVRADTPGVQDLLHLNNAGASLRPASVETAVRNYLDLEIREGGYEAFDAVTGAHEAIYDSVARLIGARPEEIALTDSATRAWLLAFHGLRFEPGDRILTSEVEYASNFISFLQIRERRGVRIEVVPSDEDGRLSVSALKSMLDERVKLVAVTHVPTNGGLINPVAEIGRLTRAAGIPFLVDACQSVGQLPIDVEAMGIDLLSATGRKYLRAPRGTGFLYVRKALLEELDPPMLDLHAAKWTGPASYELRPDARRFELWEADTAGRLGLGAAADYQLALGISNTWPRIAALAKRLRTALAEVKSLQVRDRGHELCGIVSFTVTGVAAAEVKRALRQQRINVSVSTASSTLLDMQHRGLEEVVRASVHYYNSEEELDRAVRAIAALASA